MANSQAYRGREPLDGEANPVSKAKAKTPKGAKLGALDAKGIDAVCESITDGNSLTKIATEAGVSIGTLLNWLAADPERSARAREARALAGRLWDEKAERSIEEATDPFTLARAKELAHHYRWRASKIAGKEYGDAMTLKGDAEHPLRVKSADLSDEQLLALAAGGAGG